MFPKGTPDPEYPGNATHSGVRNDGRNLVQEWEAKYKVMGARGCRGRGGTRAGLPVVGLWSEAGSVPPRVPGMCGTERRSSRHPRTPL